MYLNKHCIFHCSKSKTIHGGTSVQTIIYISITKGLCSMIDIQAMTKSKYYDHIVLLYLESRKCSSVDYFCLFLPICYCG
jgi:hypothetical protein